MIKLVKLSFLLFLASCLGAPEKGIEVDKKAKAPTASNNVVVATALPKLVMSGSSSVTNGDCTLVVLNSLDSEYQSYEPASTLSVALSVIGSGSFYSDSACATSTASTQILPASSSTSLYFKSTAIGSMTLKAQATGFASAIMSVQAIAPSVTSAPAATKLKINGPQYTMTDVCLPLALNLLDQNSNSFEAAGAMTVALAGMGNFYSDSACSASIANITLSTGEFQKMIYTRTSTAGAYVITATTGGIIGETFPLFVSPQNATSVTEYGLQMLGTSLIEEDQCSPITVNLLGSNASPVLASAIKNLTLSGSILADLYTDSGCTANLATLGSLSIASGSTSAVFYLKPSAAGNLNLSATSAGLIPGTLAITVKPVVSAPALAAAKLKIYGAQNQQSNMCVALNLALHDQNNNSFASVGATVVNFSGVSTLYTDSGCSTSTTSLTLNNGESSKIFYARVGTAGGYVLTSTSAGLSSDYFPIVVIDPPSTASVVESSLQLSGPNQFQATLCAPFNVNLLGSNGAPMLATTNRTVTLSGVLLSEVYSDSGCTTNLASLSSLSIATGFSSSVFYVKANTPQVIIMGASTPTLIPANMSLLVTTAPAVTTPVASKVKVSGAQNQQSNMCVALNLALLDQNNNSIASTGATVVNFSGISTLYTDAACSTSTTSLTLNNGEAGKIFYANVTTAGGYILSSTSAGLTSDFFSIVVLDPPATASVIESSLQLSGPNQFQATLCAPFNVNLLGSNGAPILATANRTVTLSGVLLSQVYSDNTCTTNLATLSSLSIASGSTSTVFYVKVNTAQNILMGASTPTLIPANLSLLVTSPPDVNTPVSSKIRVSGAQNQQSNMCVALNLGLLDQNNNSIASVGATVVNFTGISTLYTDSACSTSTTSLTLNNGEASKIFYAEVATAGGYVLTSTSAGLSSDYFPIVVIDPPATASVVESSLQFSGPNQFQATLCAPFNINLLGSNGAPILATANRTVTLSGILLSQVYSDSGCTTNLASLSSLSIASGSSTSVFYVKANTAQTIIMGASTPTLIPANMSLLVTTPPASTTPVASKIKVSGAQNQQSNMCVALNLSLLDQNNNAIASVGGNTVNFSGVSTLYTDSACSTSTTSLTLNNGEASKIFYASVATAGGYILTSTSAGLTNDYFSIVVIDPPATASVVESSLQLAGPNQFQATLCAPFNVNLLGSNGAPILATANRTVTLSGVLLSQVYSDSGCTTNLASLASLSIASGSTSAVFYVKANTAQSIIMGASTPTLIPANMSVLVTSPPTTVTPAETKLKISGSQSIQKDMCAPFNVTVLDQSNNAIAVAAGRTISLSGPSSVYSDSACTSSAASVSLSIGDSNKIFYVKVAAAGGSVLTAASAGLLSDQFPLVVSEPFSTPVVAESSLQFTGPSQFSTSLCAPFVVNLLGTNGLPFIAASNKSITLSGTALGNFYTDSACSTGLATLSSLSILSGSTHAVFYLKLGAPASIILGASGAGLTSATMSALVTTAVSAPVEQSLAMQGAYTADISECVPMSATVLNSNGVATAIAANRTVNLTSSNANMEIFSDPVCTSAATSLSLLAGESLWNFYVKGQNAGSFMINAASTGLISSNHPVKVLSQASTPVPYKLYLSTVSQAYHDICTPAVVSSLDNGGNSINVTANTTVNLTAAGDVTYYSDSGCTTSTTSVVINNASSSRTFYYKANSGLSAILEASASGLASSLVTLGVLPQSSATGSPVQVRLSGVSGLYTDSCNIFQVQTVDENGVPRNVSSDRTINLGGAGAGSFYSDNACTSTITATTVTTGTSSKTVYYKNMTVENLLMTAQTAGLISGTFSVVMTTNPESLGGFKIDGQQNILTSSCVPYIFTALKNNGGVKTVSSNQTFTLNSGAGVAWYTNSTCTTSVVTPTIASGQSNVTYYLKVSTPGNYLLSGSSAPLNPGILGIAAASSATDIGMNFEDVDFRVIESQGAIKLKILLTSPSPTGVVIPFTVSGSATRPQDHNLNSGTVAISAGQSFGYINLSIVDDASIESEEDLTITLGTAPAGYYNGFNSELTISVYDNDNGGTSSATSGSRYKKVAMGTNHSCAILENGTVKCWGGNASGQLGNGTTTSSSVPVYVTGLTGAIDLVLGISHTCALTSAGAVKCWGLNNYGQVGDGTSGTNRLTPQDTALTSGIVKLGTSNDTTCALSTIGELKCWGYGGYLMHGQSVTTNSLTPTLVSGLNAPVVQFSMSGNYSTFALTASGTLYSWGYNSSTYGNLGRSLGTTSYPPGVVISNGVLSLPTGKIPDYSMCVLMAAGGAKCWGANTYGNLGDGTVAAKQTPTDVLGISSGISSLHITTYNSCVMMNNGDLRCWGYYSYYIPGASFGDNVTSPTKVLGMQGSVVDFIINYNTACAVYSTGAVGCWGNNNSGQVGDGTNVNKTVPTFVDGFSSSGVKFLTSNEGGSYTSFCAITTSGKLKCWGYNASGQLGDGTNSNRYLPTDILEQGDVIPLRKMASLSSGTNSTCGQQADSLLFGCWGYNNNSQLGNGSTVNSSFVQPDFTINEIVTQYSVGDSFACAIVTGGVLKCWGLNTSYQLGDGTTTSKTLPTTHPTLSSGIINVALGGYHGCAVTGAGAVKCWGTNSSYQLGTGSTSTGVNPVDPTGLASGVAKVMAGNSSSCALTTTGGLKCWGAYPGDNTTSKTVPTNVTGLTSGVSDAAMGSNFTCALTTTGGVKCWGINTYGNLGDTTTTTRNTAVDVTGLTSGVKAIATAVGANHACAINSSDNVVCWGYNNAGQLGDGTTTNRSSPVAVSGLGAAKAISVGTSHSCAVLLSNGEVRCWGGNSYMQLGTGVASTNSLTPVTAGHQWSVDYVVPKIYTGKKHSCMTYIDKLYCWGANDYGQLGLGTTSVSEDTAQESTLAFPIERVTLGAEHTCVILKGGHTTCFGRNNRGQLGDGTTVNKTNVHNFILRNVANIASGDEFTCANGGLGMKCWGANNEGQLGDGTYTDRSTPGVVYSNKTFNGSLFAGSRSMCANSVGSTYCWGYNGSNQFGLGYNGATSLNEPTPLQMSFKEIGIGEEHVCGVRNSGDVGVVYCAGYNNYGQLGSNDGDKESFTPVDNLPVELKNVSKLQVGEYHACVKDEGSEKLFCWGRNNYGQLGQARFATSFSPKYVPGTDSTFDFSSSWNHLCFIQKIPSSSNVKPPQCFGYGQDGQLGNNDTQNINVPVFVQGAP